MNDTQVQTLIHLKSEVNTIHPAFVKEIVLPIRIIEVGAKKIDNTMVDIYGMVVTALSVMDKTYQFLECVFLF